MSLKAGLAQLALQMDEAPLLLYLNELEKWNKTYNLTAIRRREEMVIRHLLDSLAIHPFLTTASGPIADVGTGAGLPGIPLALAFPERQFILYESIGKKVRFLEHAVRTLKLPNVEIVGGRVEEETKPRACSQVVSRAFSALPQFIHLTQALLAEHGEWLAMKGQVPLDELKSLQHPYQIHQYEVPGLQEHRCVVRIKN